MTTTSQQVAETILIQLGGRKFVAMTGASKFLAIKDGLSFFIPQSKGIRKVTIVLGGNDLYRVDFYGVRKDVITYKGGSTDVYFDRLQDIFTEATGLYTHL
jgi:hypothetical protein